MFDKTYVYNDNYFQNIDTPYKAYWIGFFYADGYITKSNHFGCELKEEDKNQLIYFLNEIQGDIKQLHYQPNTNSYRLVLSHSQFIQHLKSIGFIVEKSYDKTLTVWNNIPNEFKKDFVLGLWDGDGSFSIPPSSGKNTASLICNNDILIQTIADYINSHLGQLFCKVKPRTKRDPYPRIRLSQNKAKIFGDWLYKNITYSVLEKKYQIYKKFNDIRSTANYGFNNPRTKGVVCLETNKFYITAKECCLMELNTDNISTIKSITAVCRGEKKSTKGKHFRFMTEQEREDYKNGKFDL